MGPLSARPIDWRKISYGVSKPASGHTNNRFLDVLVGYRTDGTLREAEESPSVDVHPGPLDLLGGSAVS
jgi:hypothetical protein